MHAPLRDFDDLPNSAFVRLPIVTALFACSPATILRCMRAKRFPQPVRHFDRVVAWNVGELRRALQGQRGAL